MTVSEDFTGLTGRFRGELLAHCYRMLGSAEEAEDLVQETYLRAWRSYDGFEGRASVRTWLYRIATNVCLTAIERRGRRPLPSGLGGPAEDMEPPLVAGPEVPWLQPFPGALLAGEGEDPAAAVVSRAGIRLGLRLVPVMANGERAFAVYQREPGRAYHAHAVLAPAVTATGIARIVAFQDPGLFGSFGLPQEYGAGSGPAPARG